MRPPPSCSYGAETTQVPVFKLNNRVLSIFTYIDKHVCVATKARQARRRRAATRRRVLADRENNRTIEKSTTPGRVPILVRPLPPIVPDTRAPRTVWRMLAGFLLLAVAAVPVLPRPGAGRHPGEQPGARDGHGDHACTLGHRSPRVSNRHESDGLQSDQRAASHRQFRHSRHHRRHEDQSADKGNRQHHGGTDRAQSLHFKPGTWFTMANSTATEGLPMPWVESNIIDQGDTYKERPSTILDNSLCQEG